MKSVGRTVALALLLQVVLAPFTYFRWMRPATQPGFLETGAEHATAVRVGALIAILLAGMTLVVAIAVLPLVRQQSERLAILFVALAAVGLATISSETVAIRHLLTLSIEYARPGATPAVLELLAATGRSNWVAAHYTNLVFSHLTILLMYVILYRLALAPRLLAGAGVLACTLSTIAVASPLVGEALPFRLVTPVGICNVLLALWLGWHGLSPSRVPPAPIPSVA